MYLAPVPVAVYEFQIGGYQPLDKYLKSRKGRDITQAERETLRRAVAAIAFTLASQREIDGE